MRKFLLTFVFIFLSLITVFTGCGEKNKPLPYNSSTLNVTIKDNFLYAEENRINIAYRNENYDPDDPNSQEYLFDETLPSSRVILLTEQSQLEEAFETAPSVDLTQQMVAVILFAGVGSTYAALQDIIVENGVLEIVIEKQVRNMVTEPYLMEFSVRMDKMDITGTKVTFVKK